MWVALSKGPWTASSASAPKRALAGPLTVSQARLAGRGWFRYWVVASRSNISSTRAAGQPVTSRDSSSSTRAVPLPRR